VARVLGLEGVIPVLGLVVGRPASRPEARRRQSPGAVYSIDVAPGSEARGEGLLSLYGLYHVFMFMGRVYKCLSPYLSYCGACLGDGSTAPSLGGLTLDGSPVPLGSTATHEPMG